MRFVHDGASLVDMAKQDDRSFHLFRLLTAFGALEQGRDGRAVEQEKAPSLQQIGTCIKNLRMRFFNSPQELSLVPSQRHSCQQLQSAPLI